MWTVLSGFGALDGIAEAAKETLPVVGGAALSFGVAEGLDYALKDNAKWAEYAEYKYVIGAAVAALAGVAYWKFSKSRNSMERGVAMAVGGAIPAVAIWAKKKVDDARIVQLTPPSPSPTTGDTKGLGRYVTGKPESIYAGLGRYQLNNGKPLMAGLRGAVPNEVVNASLMA